MITYIQLFVFLAYITFIISKFGILPSISDSWYELEKNKRNSGILFTLFLWVIGFLMFFQTNGNSGFFFASGAGLMFVGAATQFKEKITKTVHYIGSFSGLLFPLIALWFERGVWLPLAISVVVFISTLFYNLKDETWWLEISIILFIILGMFL